MFRLCCEYKNSSPKSKTPITKRDSAKFHRLALNETLKAHMATFFSPPAEIRLVNFQLWDGLCCFQLPPLACLCHDLFVVMISDSVRAIYLPGLRNYKAESPDTCCNCRPQVHTHMHMTHTRLIIQKRECIHKHL